MSQAPSLTAYNYEYVDAISAFCVNQPQPVPVEAVGEINMDELRRLDSRVVPSNPAAPIGSSKNPLKIVQEGDSFISMQDISPECLNEIVNVVSNKEYMKHSVVTIYDPNVNKRYIIRVVDGNRRRQQGQSAPNSGRSQASSQDGNAPRRRGRRPGRKNKTPEEEDPDFEPDVPEEEVLPFPILRKKTPVRLSADSSSQVRPSKRPKYLSDYKQLRLDEFSENEDDAGRSGKSTVSPSEEDSNFGYSDYEGAVDLDSEGKGNRTTESLDFPCDQCERSFASRAGVSRHKLLKHNPNGETRHIGPWSDPALAALRRRNRLKEALEKATPDDIADIAAPKVAQTVSLWDYLIYRTEATTTTPNPRSNPPLPPPELTSLTMEFLAFVERFQKFFKEHSKPVSCVEAQAPELDLDEEMAAISCGKPAPASVKRKRYLKMLKRKQSAANNVISNQDVPTKLEPGVSPAEGISNENPVEPQSLTVTNNGAADPNEGVIEVTKSTDANLLGVEVGGYNPVLPFSRDYFPRRYDVTPKEPENAIQSEPPSPIREMPPCSAPKRAKITTGEQIEPAIPIFEAPRLSEPDESESTPEPDPEDVEEPTSEPAPSASEQNYIISTEGIGHPIPEEWITNGSFAPVYLDSGVLSDFVLELSTNRFFQRSTGNLVTDPSLIANVSYTTVIADEEGTSNSTTAANNASGTTVLSNASYTAAINNALGAALTDSGTYAVEIDNGTDANSSTTESEPTKLFVSNISSDLCIVTRPDGVQYEVRHNGKGITAETLQAILQMNSN